MTISKATIFVSVAAVFWFVAPATAMPAQKTEVAVDLSNGIVKIGERASIRIQLTATNAKADKLKSVDPPEVEGLTFGAVGGPATFSEFVRGPRGRMTERSSFTYTIPVTASGKGKYVIPPLTLKVGDREVRAPLEPMELEVVEDLVGSRVLVLEMQSVPDRVYEGEPYTLEFTLGWASSLSVDGMVLQVPWYGRQDGVIPLAKANSGNMVDFPIGPGRNRSAAMEDFGRRRRDGDEYRLFSFKRRFVGTRPGTIEFPRTVLQVNERRLRDRFGRTRVEPYYQVIPKFSIEVVPVPEEGRPVDWSGAIGDVEVDRDVRRRDIDAGDSLKFELSYSGEGNLEFFDPPDLSRVAGFDNFRVLGVEDQTQPYLRIIEYDLVPLSADVTEIPPVPLSVFDTESGTFNVIESDPVEIRVRAGEAGAEDPFEGLEDVDEEVVPEALRDIAARPRTDDERLPLGPAPGTTAMTLFASIIGWVSLRRYVRRRGDPNSVVARRRRGALGRLKRDLGSSRASTDPRLRALALERFLSARTNTEPEAWIGRSEFDASDGFVASEELQEEFLSLRSELDRPVFAGDAHAPDREGDGAADRSRILAFADRAIAEGL